MELQGLECYEIFVVVVILKHCFGCYVQAELEDRYEGGRPARRLWWESRESGG